MAYYIIFDSNPDQNSTMLNRQNQQLQKKYKNTSSFAEYMDKISQKFREFEQQAYYSELQESAHKMIISILPHTPLSTKLNNVRQLKYHIIIGAKQPPSFEKIILNIIHLIPRPKQTYSIIFINTGAHKDAYNDFMKATEFLPIEYFKHLEKIHVLHASFMNKAMGWITFNTITGYVKGKTQFYSEFEELGQKIQLNQFELLNLFPIEIKKQIARHEEYVDQLLNKYAMKLVTMADLMGKPNKSEDYKLERETGQRQSNVRSTRQPIFKSTIVMASNVKKAQKRYIEDYEVGQTGAPLPLELLIYYFKQRDDMLKVEGIFRKSVSVDDQNQILAELDDRNYNFIDTVTNPHIIANAIKRFTINFISPVIPFEVFDAFMLAKEPTLTPLVIQSIKNLASLRKMTIMILCQFFMEKVIPKQPDNKMSLKNICIVLAPCIMRAEVISIKDIIYSQKAIMVTSIIFREFDNIFGDKKARQQSIRTSAKHFSKMYLEDRLGNVELKPASLTHSQNEVITSSQKQEEERQASMSSKGDKQDVSNRSSQEHEAILKRQRTVTLCQKISDTIKEELEFQESQKSSKMKEESENQYEVLSQDTPQTSYVFKTFERQQQIGELQFDYPEEKIQSEEMKIPQQLKGINSADARLTHKKGKE